MRLHLFEFEDFDWFPDVIRQGETDYLHYVISKAHVYKPAVEIMDEIIQNTDYEDMFDLCSGGGGGVNLIQRDLEKISGKEIKIILSDKYPNIDAFEKIKKESAGKINYIKEPVDILDLPQNTKCIRTIFSAFHHFKPEDAKAIIRGAVDDNVPIAVFEGAAKDIKNFLGILLFTPVIFLLITPFLRPFRLSRIFFTYFVPLIPIITVWDGLVSILRMYSPGEMLAMANSVTENGYIWRSGKAKNSIGSTVTYLIGYKPK